MKKKAILPTLLILAPLFLFGLFSLLQPDAVYSEREKRELAAFPEFSFSSLLDGSFAASVDDWYSDTFPMRDRLIALAGKLRSAVLLSDLLSENDTLILPGAQTVAVAPAASDDGAQNAAENLAGILYTGDRLFECYAESDSNTAAYAASVDRLQSQTGLPVFLLLPTPAYTLYAPDTMTGGGDDFRASLSALKTRLSEDVTVVDLDAPFTASADGPIYFRTDHHWTADGAYLAASALADALGLPIPALSAHRSGEVGGFLGSLYNSAATQSVAPRFEKNPDAVRYYLPTVSYTLTSYASIGLDDGTERVLVDPDFCADSNLYNVFCGGDMPIAHIHSDVGNGLTAFVVRDSYGHALLPFLSELFEDVWAIDPRYYSADYTVRAADFCAAHDCDLVVVCNYTPMALGAYWTDFAQYIDVIAPAD